MTLHVDQGVVIQTTDDVRDFSKRVHEADTAGDLQRREALAIWVTFEDCYYGFR